MKDEPGGTQQDLIHVEETVREEMQADHAELFVTIRGSSFVAGTAALTKAREVSQLVADLQQAGISESDIHVQDVQAEVSTGVLGRNSSAIYKLRVVCKTLDRFADILGAITAQKNTKLDYLWWLYPDDDAVRDRLLKQAIARANTKSQLIASALEVRLMGISSFEYKFSDPVKSRGYGESEIIASYNRKASWISKEDLAMHISHMKELSVTVTVAYRISELQSVSK